jgi:hypothetical protein
MIDAGAYMNDNQVSAAPNRAAAFDNPTYSPQFLAGHERLRGPSAETSLDEKITERTTSADVSYDRQRASEERTAALQSRDLRARRVHVALAERYEERVRQSMSSAQGQLWH